MDNFIRRIRSLSFLSAISGALSIHVVVSFLSLQDDFARVQRLFFASLLISDEYVANVDPLHVQTEFADVATEEDWERIKTSSPPAESYIGETNNFFDAVISLSSGISFEMRLAETVLVTEESAVLFDLVAPDGGDKSEVKIQRDLDRIAGNGVECPTFEALTNTSFDEEWKLTCFHVTRVGANNETESIWVIDGRPIDLTYDIIKEEKLFYIDELLTASGDSTYYWTYSQKELEAELLSLTEKHFVGNGNKESQYSEIRNLFYNQEFSIPIVNIKTSFKEYFFYFIYLNFILAFFYLHTAIGIYDRSNFECPDEPWIMLIGRSESRLGSIIRIILRFFGACATIVSITLPTIAILVYFYRLDVSVTIYQGILASSSIILQLLSIAYLWLSALRLEKTALSTG